jgi:hypothetical protein
LYPPRHTPFPFADDPTKPTPPQFTERVLSVNVASCFLPFSLTCNSYISVSPACRNASHHLAST